jgi:hypothetical protein
MPVHMFQRDGLVHALHPKTSAAWCGIAAVPYGQDFQSTDEAVAYGQRVSVDGPVPTCLECIGAMP